MKREDKAVLVITAATPVYERHPGIWQMLREDVACVVERDPAARSRFEVWTIYPACRRWPRTAWRMPCGGAAGAICRVCCRSWRVLRPAWTSTPGARIGRRFFIDHGAGVVIGETAEIGNDVTLYHGVTLGGTSWSAGKRHPTLGDGVVVGAGAKILGPITIGERARVAANSVVIEEVPAGATVVGIPGRVVVPRHQRHATHGIDLAHHLIPDPVGKAIGCLLERIADLEREMVALRGQPSPGEGACHSCDDSCTSHRGGGTRA